MQQPIPRQLVVRRFIFESLEPRRVLDSTVVFNEVMYNPVEAESNEWVELHNQMSVAVDLSSWTLANAVHYEFPKGTYLSGGGYLVVAADPAFVMARYGLTDVLGPFSGRLSNGGERIELRNHTDRLMNSLQYTDGGLLDDGWPVGPDGTGASLAKRFAQSASDDAANWTVSRQLGGTPAAANFDEIGSLDRTILVSIDSDWRYDQSGRDLGSAWRNPGFDDSAWSLGTALLQNEKDDLPAPKQTELNLGIATYYFRTSFEFTGTANDDVFRFNHVVDDGAVFYVNGQEVERFRMDDAHVDFSTLSSSSTSNANFVVSNAIDPSVLRQGTNTLAVEVHQDSLRSNDIVFGTELWWDRRVGPPTAPADVVILNEVAGAGDSTSAWVEIYNSGDHSVSLEDWQLADTDGGLATLPPVTLEANSFHVLSRDQLGFGTRAGQRLFLTAPNNRFVDAARVDKRPIGRSQEVNNRWQPEQVTTPGKTNEISLSSDVVINEIMYHRRPTYAQPGIEFAKSAEEWIEIYNRGTSPVDISDWRLNDAVRFIFASNTVLAAGEYAVIAWDANAMAVKYPDIRILGQFEGRLSNADERIQLLDAGDNIADEVHYFEGGYWPEFADGDGASLELVDAQANNAHATAWAPSRELDRAAWQRVSYRSTLTEIVHGAPIFFNELVIGLLDKGEVWLDNFSVQELRPEGSVELIQNGSFQLDASGQPAEKWRSLGTHAETTVMSDRDDPSNHVLRLVATGRMNYLSNHLETTFVDNRPVEIGKTYEISYDARWITGSPQLHTELYHKQAARTTILNQPEMSGTPGAKNSVTASLIADTHHGPTFAELRHAPVIPTSRQSVTVSVMMDDPDGIAAADVVYRVDGDAEFTHVPMQSDGLGTYAAQLPPQSDATLVQFYVKAQDHLGATTQYPPQGPDSRALYRVEDRFDLNPKRHTFQILMMATDVDDLHDELKMMDNNHLGSTVVYDGTEAFYDAGTRLRGSMYTRPRLIGTGYNVRFRPDQLFRGVHDSVGFDQNGEREILVKYLNTQSGNVGGSYEDALELVTPSGFGGGATLVYLARHTDIYIDEQFGPDGGTVFKLEGIRVLTDASDPDNPESLKLYRPIGWVGGFDIADLGDDKEIYRWPYLINGNRARDDYSGIIAMAQAFSAPDDQLEQAVADVLDIDSWTTTFALMSILGVGDVYSQGGAHNVNFYAPANGSRIMVMPWDWDSMLAREMSSPLRGGANVNRIFDIPTYEHYFLGRMRDLLETVAHKAHLEPWVDRYGDTFDANFGGVAAYVDDRSAILRSQLPSSVPFQVGPASVNVVDEQLVSADTPSTLLIPSTENGGDALKTAWTETDFVASGEWQTGSAAVGFDDGNNEYTPFIKTPVPEMRGNNASVFVRIPFELKELPDENASLFLRMQYDDGFVAYLNGVRVASRNAPVDLAWDSDAQGSHRNNLAVLPIRIDLNEFRHLLKADRNVLAIHGLNSSASNRDTLFAPELIIARVNIQEGTDQPLVTDQPTIDVEGIGWIDVREIRLSGSDQPLPVHWDTLTEWTAKVPVEPGENQLTLQAFDYHGQLIGSQAVNVIRRTVGDLNGDGRLNISDVDLLCAALRDDDDRAMFDLNSDQRVNEQDLEHMIQTTLGTAFGDANLDGRFDSADLVEVFAAGQYNDGVPNNSSWGTGDWNCDGDFDTADLVAAFQAGHYVDAQLG